MLKREPTALMIEALEDGVVHNVPFDEFRRLCDESPQIMKLYVRLLEDGLIESLRKTDAQRFESARERYENFVRQYPEAARRAPGKHIASYLLMTPESLSRVRAGLLK
jgi:CRP-like cAMP-binding protein